MHGAGTVVLHEGVKMLEVPLWRSYLAGCILLGVAPCTAMVLVWGYLARGNDGLTLVMVAVNSLMAMVGGTLVAVLMGKNDPGFAYNGPLAGLVAVCAGSDLMHPLGALVVGGVAGALFVVMFTLTQNKWKIDDVLGVWPLHGLCGTWGGVAAGIFGSSAFGGLGGVSLSAQLIGTALGVVWALLGGTVVYGVLKATVGLKLSAEEEYEGADLSVHKINATPDREVSW